MEEARCLCRSVVLICLNATSALHGSCFGAMLNASTSVSTPDSSIIGNHWCARPRVLEGCSRCKAHKDGGVVLVVHLDG
jgi:hypothetical protein